MAWTHLAGHTVRGTPHRLLAGSTHSSSGSYQQAFADIASAHCGLPVAEILPLLRAAVDTALFGFTHADFAEQADAISRSTRYELWVRVTGQ
ncbi:hypothetical protein ACFCZ6_33525 [Streptomyces hydrogenans]|uniref:hypothetical protein n=1 Tax=Streptomyces hydrogenans TaxID=1873719 RepID=UPI0035E0B725